MSISNWSLEPVDDYNEYDMHYEYENSAYDEDGNAVVCSICGEEMMWDPVFERWVCDHCEIHMDRPEYFNYIGADPKHEKCMNDCNENYPHCRSTCPYFDFDEE